MDSMHGRTLAVLLVLSIGTTAIAQTIGSLSRGVEGLLLLSNEPIRKELKLDSRQAEALVKGLKSLRARSNRENDIVGAVKVPAEVKRTMKEGVRKSSSEDAQDLIKQTLTAEQFTRFTQIDYQARKVSAFDFPEVKERLKFTPEQAEKIHAVVESCERESKDIVKATPRDREEQAKKLKPLREAKMDELLGRLSEDQRKAWKEMLGEPYRVK